MVLHLRYSLTSTTTLEQHVTAEMTLDRIFYKGVYPPETVYRSKS